MTTGFHGQSFHGKNRRVLDTFFFEMCFATLAPVVGARCPVAPNYSQDLFSLSGSANFLPPWHSWHESCILRLQIFSPLVGTILAYGGKGFDRCQTFLPSELRHGSCNGATRSARVNLLAPEPSAGGVVNLLPPRPWHDPCMWVCQFFLPITFGVSDHH
jgi:hypothetical protein